LTSSLHSCVYLNPICLFQNKTFEFFVWHFNHFRSTFLSHYWRVMDFWRSHVALPFHISNLQSVGMNISCGFIWGS
jgi:hypothetical protein